MPRCPHSPHPGAFNAAPADHPAADPRPCHCPCPRADRARRRYRAQRGADGAGAPSRASGAGQVSAFAQVRVSLLRAVQMLQSLQPQGQVLTAAFTVPAEGTAAYAVTTLINGSERHYLVDAADGGGNAEHRQARCLRAGARPDHEGRGAGAAGSARRSAQAVIAAQREGGGNAIETAYEEVRGTTYYLAHGGRGRRAAHLQRRHRKRAAASARRADRAR